MDKIRKERRNRSKFNGKLGLEEMLLGGLFSANVHAWGNGMQHDICERLQAFLVGATMLLQRPLASAR